MSRCVWRIMLPVVLICAGVSYGVATGEVGPDSALGHPTVAQPDWPVGLVELPRHESRVYSLSEIGELFYFKASPDQIGELIALFSKTRIRDHEMFVKERTKQDGSVYRLKIDYNVTVSAPGGFSPKAARKGEVPSTYEPTLTVYVDMPADRGLAERIRLPDNIIVNNEVAAFALKGRATKPKREYWYSQVQFDNSTPAVDFEHGVITKVTLWEKDVKDGIPLGKLDHEGFFGVPLAEKEIADLKAGRSWLTLTAGNWLTDVRSDHPKLSWKSFSPLKEKAQAITIAKPRLYYGRLMFEDGSPATSGPWLGRDLRVDFPYTGSVQVEPDGYFGVCFTGDQLEKAKSKRERKNIYIPDHEHWNRASAKFVFPVSKLAQDKEKAGVVAIPRPIWKKDP